MAKLLTGSWPTAELSRQVVGNYLIGHGKLLNMAKKCNKATKMSNRAVRGDCIFTAHKAELGERWPSFTDNWKGETEGILMSAVL